MIKYEKFQIPPVMIDLNTFIFISFLIYFYSSNILLKVFKDKVKSS